MEWQKMKRIQFRKSMKFLTLLLTSMIIATVSATVYYSLIIESAVTTATPVVKFVAGADSTAANAQGYETDGTWVWLAGLKAYPNATLTYEQAINIKNTDNTNWHSFRLRHGEINNDTDTSNFYSIVFKLIAPNGTQYGGDFTYDNADGDDVWDPPSAMGYINMKPGEEWSVKVVTKAASGATMSATAKIIIYVDVQE